MGRVWLLVLFSHHPRLPTKCSSRGPLSSCSLEVRMKRDMCISISTQSLYMLSGGRRLSVIRWQVPLLVSLPLLSLKKLDQMLTWKPSMLISLVSIPYKHFQGWRTWCSLRFSTLPSCRLAHSSFYKRGSPLLSQLVSSQTRYIF